MKIHIKYLIAPCVVLLLTCMWLLSDVHRIKRKLGKLQKSIVTTSPYEINSQETIERFAALAVQNS